MASIFLQYLHSADGLHDFELRQITFNLFSKPAVCLRFDLESISRCFFKENTGDITKIAKDASSASVYSEISAVSQTISDLHTKSVRPEVNVRD